MAVKVVELHTHKCVQAQTNNCDYSKRAGGCFPSESKQCEIQSGAYKNTPRGVQNKTQQTQRLAKMWNMHSVGMHFRK